MYIWTLDISVPHDLKIRIFFPSHIHRNRVLSPSPAAKDTEHIEPKSSNIYPGLPWRKERSTKIECVSQSVSLSWPIITMSNSHHPPTPSMNSGGNLHVLQKKRYISNAVASLKGSETALNVWMKLKAAANRYIEDAFILFVKVLTLILSYLRWHKRKALLAWTIRSHVGRSQES